MACFRVRHSYLIRKERNTSHYPRNPGPRLGPAFTEGLTTSALDVTQLRRVAPAVRHGVVWTQVACDSDYQNSASVLGVVRSSREDWRGAREVRARQ